MAEWLMDAAGNAQASDNRTAERVRMVEEQLVHPNAGGGAEDDFRIRNQKVLDAMRKVPRHWFVPGKLQAEAYSDRPLPIGWDQTISQPYIVALMTELLDPHPNWKVLEVGTGSGYQTAILAQFTPNVWTIEIVEPLQKQARLILRKFGLGRDRVIYGDGYVGLPEIAPFDGIIVTASADEIPKPLLEQLKPGGRMVIPVGPAGANQRLVVLEQGMKGRFESRTVLPVLFVPLVRGNGKAQI